MKADGAWKRTIQAALDHGHACGGAMMDALDEWRHHEDAAASRERIGEYLARAKKHARQLVDALEQIQSAPQEEGQG